MQMHNLIELLIVYRKGTEMTECKRMCVRLSDQAKQQVSEQANDCCRRANMISDNLVIKKANEFFAHNRDDYV